MKKNNFIKKALVALTFAVAVAVMVPAAGSVEAQAAKKVTANAQYQKAPTVKTGTTTVTSKKNKVSTAKWVKFKAPKTGTYKFTVSNFKPADETNCGHFNFYTNPASYDRLENLKTEGGRNDNFSIASKKFMAYYKPGDTKKKDRYRTSRSVTINMTKGQVVYMRLYYTTGDKYTYSLNIKKTK